MKRGSISNNVIRRLPRYVRKLDELEKSGVSRISSGELGRQMGLTPSQIRQDFSCFGEFGQQGYGYNVELLREQINGILGIEHHYSVIVVGVGNIGRALTEHFDFAGNGFQVIGAFDIQQELLGTEVAGVPIHSCSEIPEYVREHQVDIAVLTVPRHAAASMARILSDAGVKAIWNVTNADLELGEGDALVENMHFSDSLMALSYFLTEKLDAEKNGAAV